VHAAIEKGLAYEQSVFADSFALGGLLFLQFHGLTDEHSYGLKDSIAKGQKFKPKTRGRIFD
jgi:hypothetical protein